MQSVRQHVALSARSQELICTEAAGLLSRKLYSTMPHTKFEATVENGLPSPSTHAEQGHRFYSAQQFELVNETLGSVPTVRQIANQHQPVHRRSTIYYESYRDTQGRT